MLFVMEMHITGTTKIMGTNRSFLTAFFTGDDSGSPCHNKTASHRPRAVTRTAGNRRLSVIIP
jgi:hypothetical protein